MMPVAGRRRRAVVTAGAVVATPPWWRRWERHLSRPGAALGAGPVGPSAGEVIATDPAAPGGRVRRGVNPRRDQDAVHQPQHRSVAPGVEDHTKDEGVLARSAPSSMAANRGAPKI